jgi:tricorn protease
MRKTRLLAALGLASLAAAAMASDARTAPPAPAPGTATKLLRFPDIAGDRVAFTYAGDIWIVDAQGGEARRLTTHPGVELFAKFSPDGRQIAFTGQYEGDEQVYVVDAAGGEPRQLTFYPASGPLPPRWGYDNQVYDWSPDGKSVLFRSMRDAYEYGDTQLFTVPAAGGLSTALPMPYAGAGDLSPDGKKVVYSPLFRDFRHWKRYEGGWAQNLYLFDLKTWASERITDNVRTERDPMWIGDAIYFAADWDGRHNLYAYDQASKQSRQLTRHAEWDVRWPSSDKAKGRIVYELGGELRILDVASGQDTAISVRVPTDALARRPARRAVGNQIQGATVAPEGKRVGFSARGDVFSVPIENGPARNLTHSPGTYDKEPAWSPDGQSIAYVSDQDGEEEIWIVEQGGREPARQLTDGSVGRYSNLSWAPDSRHIAYRDEEAILYVLDVETKKVVKVDDDPAKFGLSTSWSPCSTWLAYSKADPNGFRSLYLWNRGDGKSRRVTGEMWNEASPTFDDKGEYLYFLSERMHQPQISQIEFNYALNRRTGIYAMALRKDVPHLFPPKSDEVPTKAGDKKGEGKEEEGKVKKKDDAKDKDDKKDGDDAKVEPIRVDFDGLAQRVTRVPVDFDNYVGLGAAKGRIFYIRGTSFYYGRDSEGSVEFYVFDIGDRKSTRLAENVEDVAGSPEGEKVLLRVNGSYQLYDANAGGKDSAKPIKTDAMKADLVPADEWAQMFDDAWRYFRDYFYVPNMHGVDWEGIRKHYAALLPWVAHRSDLNYLIAEMIAELNTSHTYVAGGDFEIPARPRGALLGARFELDAAAGRYKIAKIFEGQNEEDSFRSPLTEIGVDVSVGDYVLAINGQELRAADHPEAFLRRAEGDQVELTVNGKPTFDGSRHVVVRPIRSEDSLIYLAWTHHNRRYVEEKSGGKLGYIHIPDMGEDGIREFVKWYYGQLRKEGLVIDVRSNGGGNVSQMILERLRRELLMVDYERHAEYTEGYPDGTFVGHLACLLDEDTASDGDQFSYVFRAAGLGPLIGKRSWGGVVGIYGSYPLMDGGGVSVPEAGSGDPKGRWIIEGYGVQPDIEVDNDPGDLLRGKDAQLDKAIEYLLDKVAKEPRRLPARPAPPVKTGGSSAGVPHD